MLNQKNFIGNPALPGVQLYTLRLGTMACSITNYGARIISLSVPDKNGAPCDVALGHPALKDYLQAPEEYMGAAVGRCANRIAGGQFLLDGREYSLPVNNGPNTLHGGIHGLHGVVWTVESHTDTSLVLQYTSKDGEEGFPGNIAVTAYYELQKDATLSIRYKASTDAPTLVNISNHAYWNLSGEGAATILAHTLQLRANAFTPINGTLIPTGEIKDVAGTPFNFLSPKTIGHDIDATDAQLAFGKGYDHNFVLDGDSLKPAAILHSGASGITMELYTNQPGMQFYSGNFLDGTRAGKSGKSYNFRSAVVLEPQGFPDAVHHPDFPSVVLRPGEQYRWESRYVFSCAEAI